MRNIMVYGLKLFIVTVVAGLLLGIANYITRDAIAARALENERVAYEQALLAQEYTPIPMEDETFAKVVSAQTQNEVKGFVFCSVVKGYGGEMWVYTGISVDGAVTGVFIGPNAETAGLGSNATKPSFRNQFIGANQSVRITKTGDGVHALTGATITSNAVVGAVNTAIEYYLSNSAMLMGGN